jgi:hypothetical protein
MDFFAGLLLTKALFRPKILGNFHFSALYWFSHFELDHKMTPLQPSTCIAKSLLANESDPMIALNKAKLVSELSFELCWL